MVKKNIQIILLFITLFFLIGCAAPEPTIIRKTVTVEVPVYVPIEPPAYLLAAMVVPGIPVFYKPAVKGAASCLKQEGEFKLKQIIYLLSARIDEWRIFASPEKVKHD